MAGSSAIDDPLTTYEGLTTRFGEELARLNPGGRRIGLAVSGGPDSMAMLLLAHAALPQGFEVATVNHGLRPEAAEECALVQAECAARAIACTVLPVTVRPGNMQQGARLARYEALAGWARARGLTAIATAHHADDQAETLLMRLGRGSGVAGLAGVRARGMVAEFPVIRPLLAVRRAELAAIVAEAGITAADDPSNRDPKYDRVRIRQSLAKADWIDPVALAHSAGLLAEADAALSVFEQQLWATHVENDGETYRLIPPQVPLMRLRLVRRIITMLGGNSRGREAARLVERLEQGEGGNLGGVLAEARADCWQFSAEPPRRA